jgi:hypothetical protein
MIGIIVKYIYSIKLKDVLIKTIVMGFIATVKTEIVKELVHRVH